ncbi:LANO_0F04852g1_1 [Lachancea nothofagi CBS 11611]|uniref:LANO_0F04852g1_1 n=1 Tax=Lachancea nothofagi CBS 11611 TaxID=1266666 RepID=A0A1G4K7T6_9SACH|nr:LANO_0F04852g1_1 [Lachancea nothofagi CBS 11611]
MLRLPTTRSPALLTRTFTVYRPTMSGHNKWSTIKHDKAKHDGERNKLFNKFANHIALAVKLGGGSTDTSLNVRLAAAIESANKNNVTRRVVENAIRKGSGATDKDGAGSEACVYEGMGPGGVAFVVEALTDNKNRTIGLVRSTFTKIGGSMTPTLYFFERKGSVLVRPPKTQLDFDQVMETVLEIDGVEDLETLSPEEQEKEDLAVEYGSTVYEITTDPAHANLVASCLKDKGFHIQEVNIGYVPKSDMLVEIGNDEAQSKIDKFMAQLDEIDDVTDFYCNLKR